jgi:hypothetical protein
MGYSGQEGIILWFGELEFTQVWDAIDGYFWADWWAEYLRNGLGWSPLVEATPHT